MEIRAQRGRGNGPGTSKGSGTERARRTPETVDPRLADLLARKPVRLATVAMANKMARVVWAVMTLGEVYQRSQVPMLAA